MRPPMPISSVPLLLAISIPTVSRRQTPMSTMDAHSLSMPTMALIAPAAFLESSDSTVEPTLTHRLLCLRYPISTLLLAPTLPAAPLRNLRILHPLIPTSRAPMSSTRFILSTRLLPTLLRVSIYVTVLSEHHY